MPSYDWVLYDHLDWSTSANQVFTYFQTKEGKDSSHTKAITNMRGDGALPSGESYVINNISVFPDDALTIADVLALVEESYVEVVLADQIVFQAPLRFCINKSAYSGEFHEITNTALQKIGLLGGGYDLKMPIKIPGGTNFRVTLGQTAVFSAGTLAVAVALPGILTIG